MITLPDADTPGVLVKPERAARQLDAESTKPTPPGETQPNGQEPAVPGGEPGPQSTPPDPPAANQPKRFHGTVSLDATRVGRDASQIADEVIAHLAGLVGAKVTVTLEVAAEIPDGALEHVVRTVTENSRTLKFTSQGFEEE